jgi:formylglycine-generating enzyme required for sulfatase activity
MPEKSDDLRAKLQEIEDAIAAARKVLAGPALETALAPMLAQRERYAARLEGSGAIARGENAIAAGKDARVIRGDRNVMGDHNRSVEAETYIEKQTVNPDPQQAAAEQARDRYLTRLQQQCNVLPLAAMGGEEGVVDEVTLENIYVALDTRTRVPLTEEENAARQDERSYLMGAGDRDSRPLSALEAATQQTRLALLGDPGGGKSTFVRSLAAHAATAALQNEGPYPGWDKGLMPVLITLRELAPQLTALDLDCASEAERDARLGAAVREFLTQHLHACKAEEWDPGLEDALLAGDVLLIFDGLDEVAEVSRKRVRQAVGALLQTYQRLRRVIVTCRTRSYTGAAILPGFAQHTLARFDEDRIKAFVAGWYQAQYRLGRLSETVAQGRTRDLQSAALDDELRELASNPMLLTTMALIHQREVGLPRERVRLYSLAVQVLLTRWQKRKGIVASAELRAVLAQDLKLREILERLAYAAHQGQADRSRAADLQRKDLLEILEAERYLGDVGLAAEFLDYVDQRAGLLVGQGGADGGRAPTTYTFPHRTFQEYLAGCYLVGDWNALDLYWQHAGEDDAWSLAAMLGAEELRYNRRSDKVLLNLAYDLAPIGRPETAQAWRAALWSGLMAALFRPVEIARVMQGPKSGAQYLARLIPTLVKMLEVEPLRAVERVEAGKALAKLGGDPRPGVGLDADGLPDIAWCGVPAGPFLMGSRAEDELASDDEKPPYTYVIERAYSISRYPITNAQFAAFVRAGGYGERTYWTDAGWSWLEQGDVEGPRDYGEPFNLPNHPVVGVSWYEAMAFCRWLAVVLSERGDLEAGQMITLPSEAEWEKAARGTDGQVFPWGEEADPNRANYTDTGLGTTSAVGCFPGGMSPYGCLDMVGNVWEWTRSLYRDYPYDPQDGRENLEAGDDVLRVLRGGAFDGHTRLVRCASRLRLYPVNHDGRRGFRVVVPPSL